MEILWPNGLTTPPDFSWQGHFGWRDADLSYASRYHRGLDMIGFSTVHAIADGEVVRVGRYAGWEGGGYMVWIQHADVFSKSLHLAEGSALVKVGERVTAGQPIATMGATNGGGYGMAVHLHLEITEGQWHAYNSGQIDPKAWLLEHVTASSSGAGGTAARPTDDHPEEDDMSQPILVRVKDRAGRHYALDTEFIKQIKDVASVKVEERITGRKEIEVSGAEFDIMIAVRGIPSNALDSQGRVLNILEGGGYVYGGSWSRARAAERKAFEAVKAAKAK